MKNLLMVTAIIEAGAGLVFFMMPSVAAILLFGSSLDMPAAMAVGRLAGAALITLGVACWLVRSDAESRATTGLVNALLLYNLAALVILAASGFAWGLVGILLWLDFRSLRLTSIAMAQLICGVILMLGLMAALSPLAAAIVD